jgi:hypothetical protein
MTAKHSLPFGADPAVDRFTAFTDPRPNDTAWPKLAWPPSAGVVLAGDAVTLVPLVPQQHAGELFASLNDDAVWTHLAGRPATADEYRDNFEKTIAAGTHPWAVTLTHSRAGYPAGAVIGGLRSDRPLTHVRSGARR